MSRRWQIVLVAGVVMLGGCASHAPATDEAHQVPSTAEDIVMDNDGLPEAAPAFVTHFTDPIYDDPADEFAPFGTDEGWDLLHEWAERRDELSPSTTVADLIGESAFDEFVAKLDEEESPGIPAPGGQVDAATIIIGAGFTLLRLAGHIDDAGREQTLKALDVLIRRYESPGQLLRQRADLHSWTQP